jgi:hypothetical protein
MKIAFAIAVLCLPMATSCAAEPDEIARLVARLGDAKFQVREEAARQLRAIGSRAIPALSAALTGDNAEVRLRADRILFYIDPIWRNRRNLLAEQPTGRRDAIHNVVGYRAPHILDAVLTQLRVETDSECLHAQLAFVGAPGQCWRTICSTGRDRRSPTICSC